MKILIISPGGLPVPDVLGGAVQTIITNLAKCNNDVDMTIISPYNELAFNESKTFLNVNFKFFKINKLIIKIDKLIYSICNLFSDHPQSFARILKTLSYNRKIKKFLLKNNFDFIIFEHNLLLLLILKSKKVRKKLKNKYFIHIHNKLRTLKLIKKEYENANKLITISKYMKTYLLNDTNMSISPEKIAILLNSVDSTLFKPIKRSEIDFEISRFFSKNKINILFAGRINKEKGIDVLLSAYEKLDLNIYNLVVVGSTFYSTDRKDKFFFYLKEKYANLISYVTFTNFIPYKKMPYIYNMADIVVLPSMWDEPAGLAMLEAAKCHRPLITTNSGGIPEYVKNAAILLERDKEIVNNLVETIKNIDKFTFDYSFVDKIDIDLSYKTLIEILNSSNL